MADILYPYGDLDVVGYYSKIAAKLTKFLNGKEIAGKVLIPKAPRPLLTRGSQFPPLFVEELAKGVDNNFLKERSGGHHLEDAKGKITTLQEKIWRYFPPRKLADLFYATNNEKGKRIDRIFFDIDRGEGITVESAQLVAKTLIHTIEDDKDFAALTKFEVFTMYTGSSFHVYLMLKEETTIDFYNTHLAYSKSNPSGSFTGRWVEKIKKETALKIAGGHEKLADYLIVDPSQTPPGKLARAPFSLHMSDPKTIDGVAIPLEKEMLEDKELYKQLKGYTPEIVIKELDALAKRLP